MIFTNITGNGLSEKIPYQKNPLSNVARKPNKRIVIYRIKEILGDQNWPEAKNKDQISGSAVHVFGVNNCVNNCVEHVCTAHV